MKLRKRTIRFLEFAIMGVAMGMVEDSLVVFFVTGESLTLEVVGLVFLVALPFAFFTEYVVDHPRFWEALRIFRKKE